MAFLSLVPAEGSSGEKQRHGRITKMGNALVRRILIEASWLTSIAQASGARSRRDAGANRNEACHACSALGDWGNHRIQGDSSLKRPISSVTFVARVLHGLWNLPRRALKNAPTEPLGKRQNRFHSYHRALDDRSFHISLVACGALPTAASGGPGR